MQQIYKQPQGYELITSQGKITAKEVLLAKNGYTNYLIPEAWCGIFSGGSYIITTDPLSPELQASVSQPIQNLPHARYFFTPYEKLYLSLVSAWFRFLDRIS